MPGACDPRFAAVGDAFAANFAAGLEVGAACAVMVDGRMVVDLWGGQTAEGGAPWDRDTLVETRSATKGVTALCLHMLVDRGLVDLDAPVRRTWPELRADPRVRHVCTHEAGIPVIDAPLAPGALVDWHEIAHAVEIQEPLWEPGARHGYHGVTFGWLIGEIVRRVDGRSIGRFVAEEIAGPLAGDYFIGTPPSEHRRIAPLVAPPRRASDESPPPPPPAMSALAQRMFAPMFPPVSPPWNSPEFWSAEIPVANGICTARALATIYGALACGGAPLVGRATVDEMAREQVRGIDAVLGIEVRRTLGFELPAAGAVDHRPSHAFGHPGASGFLGFADLDAGVGFAYVKNAGWGGEPGRDPRAGAMVRALYDAL